MIVKCQAKAQRDPWRIRERETPSPGALDTGRRLTPWNALLLSFLSRTWCHAHCCSRQKRIFSCEFFSLRLSQPLRSGGASRSCALHDSRVDAVATTTQIPSPNLPRENVPLTSASNSASSALFVDLTHPAFVMKSYQETDLDGSSPSASLLPITSSRHPASSSSSTSAAGRRSRQIADILNCYSSGPISAPIQRVCLAFLKDVPRDRRREEAGR